MSFILDALRKAEHGRQTSPAATLPITPADVPAAPPDTRKRLIATIVLLGLIAAIIVVVVSQRDTARTPVQVAAARETPAPAAVTPVPRETRPLRSEVEAVPYERETVRALDQEIRRPDPAAVTAAANAAKPADSSRRRIIPGTVTIMGEEEPPLGQLQETPAARIPPAGNTPSVPAQYAGLPEYTNLLRSGRINLPNLSLDMHVYNRDPAKRFIFVNLKKYREGDVIDGKARIEAITTQGAVLDNNGLNFLLRPD